MPELFNYLDDTKKEILKSVEKYESTEDQKDVLLAAFVLQTLALYISDKSDAQDFIDRSEKNLNHVLELKDDKSKLSKYPNQTELLAESYLALTPLLGHLAIFHSMPPLEQIEKSYDDYIGCLSKNVKKTWDLIYDKPGKNWERNELRARLIGVYNVLSAEGLTLRLQTKMMKDGQWLPLLGGISPRFLAADSDNPIYGAWHIDIYQQDQDRPNLLYKVYIRTSETSPHSDMLDDDVSIIWIAADARTPFEKNKLVSPVQIIKELSSEDKGKVNILNARMWGIIDALDSRFYADVKSSLKNHL